MVSERLHAYSDGVKDACGIFKVPSLREGTSHRLLTHDRSSWVQNHRLRIVAAGRHACQEPPPVRRRSLPEQVPSRDPRGAKEKLTQLAALYKGTLMHYSMLRIVTTAFYME